MYCGGGFTMVMGWLFFAGQYNENCDIYSFPVTSDEELYYKKWRRNGM